jgi:hypothetical protein
LRNLGAPSCGPSIRSLTAAETLFLHSTTDPPTVQRAGGPHQQFSGDVGALCAYFAAA